MKKSKSSESFETNVSYEAARQGINNEMAWHQAARDAIENDVDPRVVQHRNAVRALIEARQLLDPDDQRTVKIARLFLRAMRRPRDSGGEDHA